MPINISEEQEDWKIWPPYEVFYIESLLTKTKSAIADYELLDKVITTPQLFKENPNILIDLAENIINQGSGISRYLFPSRYKGNRNNIHKLRGEKLREFLKISQECPLRHRFVRDYAEHFDEKLDIFLSKPIAGNFITSSIVFDSKELDNSTFAFRAYVVNEFKFICLEKQICILPIIEEIYRIHNLLIKFNNNGGRLK